MKQTQTDTLGLTVNVSVPGSHEEYDELAGMTGACVDAAVDRDLQHNWKGRFRSEFLSKVEEESGVARNVEKDENGKVTHQEKEKTYFNRVLAELGVDKSHFAELANTVAAAVPYKSTGGSGSIGQNWLREADEIIEVVGDGSFDKFIENITTANPGFQFAFEEDGSTPTRESIAFALRTEDARARAESKRKLLG
jgi:hypothetical protein